MMKAPRFIGMASLGVHQAEFITIQTLQTGSGRMQLSFITFEDGT